MANSYKKRENVVIQNHMYGKAPPQDTELEEAVLAACMLEKETFEKVLDIIYHEDCFYVDAHQKIYSAMRRLFDKGTPVDLLTITDELRRANNLEQIGGAYFLTRLTMSVLSSAHVESHARLVMEKHLKREQIRLGGILIRNGYDESVDVFEAMEEAESELFKIATTGMKKKVEHISNPTKQSLARIERQRASKVEFTGINTGFPTLNEVTGGWQNTDLIIIAARPSVGKTAFTTNLSLNSALDSANGGPVALFNLEMGANQVVDRVLSNMSGVVMNHIKRPTRLTDAEFASIVNSGNQVSKLPLFIDDTPGLTVSELRTKARHLVKKHGIKLIVIDYLQLMEGDSSNKGNREQEVSKISRDLKKMAKDMEIPIIALSQMSRGVDTQKRDPELSDLRESGAIEQDADLVMFLYRPSEKTLEQKPHLRGKVMLSIKKHRNGESEEYIVLNANNKIQKWTEYDPAGDKASAGFSNTIQTTTVIDDLPF